MTTSSCLQFLRPCERAIGGLSAGKRLAYLRFYATARSYSNITSIRNLSKSHGIQLPDSNALKATNGQNKAGSTSKHAHLKWRNDVKNRIAELQAAGALKYPRINYNLNAITCAEFKSRYFLLDPGQSVEGENVTLRGRVYSVRIAGSKLVFIDVVQEGHKVQVLCNLGNLHMRGVDEDRFREFYHIARRGDILSITGTPSRTMRGELSVDVTELPLILTPALADVPTVLEDTETRTRNRHADLLINGSVADRLRLRSHIIRHLRNFFIDDNFLEVQTPILAEGAGGAIARPFMTAATEFIDKKLSLRIAPEIWLKRLILGGMDRIFEIGPTFRNEGIDATHNPEFTTCEFYKAFADLEELIAMTEALVCGLAVHVSSLIETQFNSLPLLDIGHYATPFKRIEFIPTLELAIGRKLPCLHSENSAEKLISLFSDLSIPLPESPTLPQLLDKLSSHYLEPHCIVPTFISHHPACLAPLAKSFQDPKTKQYVSARVELFIQNREIANMYEEENSPFEQRRKFIEQVQWRDGEDLDIIDENYLEALEWGLPPTGGWGCGVDRLCMLLSGAKRISEVLSFGSLRNVVNLGS